MILSFLSAAVTKTHLRTQHPGLDLSNAPVGCLLLVLSCNGLGAEQESCLQAYGLVPGRQVTVLQHYPETVVQVEHTELAFEREVARAVQVRVV